MENNESFVAEQVTENVEQTTEQTQQEKTYTQAEVDAIVGRRLARQEAKIRKDSDRQYSDLVEVLKAGTGKESVGEITDTLKQFYVGRGIQMPQKPQYSAQDIKVLAQAEAEEIIRSGYEDVVEEVERLTAVGADNMTDREKAVFRVLAEHRRSTERSRELSGIGVTEDVYNSKEFQDFVGKFNPTVPIKDVYDIYQKTHPKKEYKTMGSMTSNTSAEGAVKDYYTRDEALKFAKKDFDENPALFKAVEASMRKW